MGAVRYVSNPPERRTGYTPCTWKMLDADVSGDAALLLLRLRRLADRDESDGYIEQRDIAALTAYHRLQEDMVTGCLHELVKLGLIEKVAGMYRDVEFLIVCRSHEQREEKREYWREAQNKGRRNPKPKPPMSNVDTHVDSHRVSTTAPSLAPSPSLSASPAPSQPAAESSAVETPMPRQADTITIVKVWEDIAGRQATIHEVSHAGWLLDQYNRLTADHMVTVMKKVHSREVTKGNPVRQLDYFDGAIRDANDAAKPQRHEPEPIGEGELPVERGNGRASAEQVQGAIAALAAKKRL